MRVANKIYRHYTAARVLFDCVNGNWDSWRDNYNRLTITDIVWIHICLHRFIASQAHYDFRLVKKYLDDIIKKEEQITITELGCWRGYLAKSLLKMYDRDKVLAYYGYDVDHYAIDTHVVDSDRFHGVKLTEWWHDMDNTYSTVMLACHTIEHFTDSQLKQILFRCNANDYKYLIWELPFSQDRDLKNWRGTNNTHMLDIDQAVFRFMVRAFGYDFLESQKTSNGYIFKMIKRTHNT